MGDLKHLFRNALVLPPFGLTGPSRVHLSGGKNLDGSFWLEIGGQPRVNIPPREAEIMALSILRALGHTIEEVPALAEVGVGGN